MYETYWKLTDSPFQNSLEDRWFYCSPSHNEALARLLFVIEQRRGCGLLVGPVGTGKSLLLRVLAGQLKRTQTQVALVDAQGLDAKELLWQLAATLRLSPSETDSRLRLWCRIQEHLRGLKLSCLPTVMIIDHIDRADTDCRQILERLCRIGSGSVGPITTVVATGSRNFPAASNALIEFGDLRIEISALDRIETELLLRDRLSKAGCHRELFDRQALDALFEQTAGLPRAIVRLCDCAMTASMAEGHQIVTAHVVNKAALELQPRRRAIHVPEAARQSVF